MWLESKKNRINKFFQISQNKFKKYGEPIKITDIRKLYLIEKLQSHNESLWSLFKKFGFACLGILLFFGIIKITQLLWKFTQNSKVKSKPQMKLVEMHQMHHVFDNSKCINEDSNIGEAVEIENQNVSDRIIQFPA